MIEQVLAHIALHARAHDVALIGDIIPAQEAEKIHHQQPNRHPGENPIDCLRAVRKEILGGPV